MKTLKIFALPSHQTKERTSGVDFVRIIQPMKHLDGFEYKGYKFKTNVFDIHSKKNPLWDDVAKEHDIIFLNYIGNAWAFAAMGCMARKFKRKIVFDLDDSLWDILKDNTAYKVYHKGSEALVNFTSMCDEVDYMLCTNTYLRNIIVFNTYKTHQEVGIIPNYIDFKYYNHRSKFKDSLDIKLMHFGSTTHFISLQNEEFEKGIDRIFKEYPNVTFKTVGAFIPKYKSKWGARYEHGYGHMDVHKWIKDKFPGYMDEADIILAPLEDNKYNRCKSSIKFLEASSAKKPGVWQNIRQYKEIVTEKNGLLADDADGWYENIKKLINDKKLRKNTGENAFKTVKGWQIQNNVKKYAEMFIDIDNNYQL